MTSRLGTGKPLTFFYSIEYYIEQCTALTAVQLFNIDVRRPVTEGLPVCRSSHNELEKNRRAHLRSCLENLKVRPPT